MLMAFGKHKGRRVEELPRDYLEWLLTTEIAGKLLHEVKRALGKERQVVELTTVATEELRVLLEKAEDIKSRVEKLLC